MCNMLIKMSIHTGQDLHESRGRKGLKVVRIVNANTKQAHTFVYAIANRHATKTPKNRIKKI